MTQINSPSITVIVCTRDRPELLQQCLSALSRQTYSHFDVLVVDNASVHPVHDICRRWGATCTLAPVPGLTRARNVGALVAQSDIIAYIDDDTIAEPGWLEAIVEDFQDPKVAAVTGRIRYMKERIDSRVMSEEEATDNVLRARRSFDLNTSDWFILACFGGIGDGGNMAFRRDLIATEQAFDERLGRGRLVDSGEEHALFAALIEKGYRITHNPQAIVKHPSPATPELQRLRKFNALRSSIAFLIFIWCEFPAHRSEIRHFLSGAVRKRIVAMVAGQPVEARLTRWQSLKAMVSGAFVYWRARRAWNSSPETVCQVANAEPLSENVKPRAAAN